VSDRQKETPDIQCGEKVQKLRPGDRVYSLAWGKFGNYVRFPAAFAQMMVLSDRFPEMESVPIVLCTAVYALNHLARLQKGESVLIQSATGGLGLAAIQIAQNFGAEIFVTVGTEDKAQYLHEECRIPQERIFSSREVTDLPKLMAATENRGFNVILSSSNGDIMHETWRCLAPRGRFIDVGRVDVQNHNTRAMEIFARNATFSTFDLSVMAVQVPEFCGK
jgi:NADPH:quinone reductase-like Zn-dependent oxidoreductase